MSGLVALLVGAPAALLSIAAAAVARRHEAAVVDDRFARWSGKYLSFGMLGAGEMRPSALADGDRAEPFMSGACGSKALG